MKRLPCCLAFLALLAAGLEHLQAQPPLPGGGGGIQKPAFSPYLNLVRPGSSATLNYYGLVRPEQQFRQSIGGLQGAVAANQQAIGGVQDEVGGVTPTGHPTQFLNYGSYFMSGGYSALNSTQAASQSFRRPQSVLNQGIAGQGMGGGPRR